MFYVSSKSNNLIGITDSDDGIEEFYPINTIKQILKSGVQIQGAIVSKGKVYIQVVDFNDSAIEMAKRLLVDSIWKSANLEGLGTTFPKTEAILENIPTDTTRDEVLFIINMKSAWKFLLDNIDYKIDLSFIRHLNKLVGQNLFYQNREIRKVPVQIGGTDWIPSIPIESLIIDSLKDILNIKNAELKALKLFCYIARTQVFIDGNKRVAQLIANKVLIENDIGIFQVPIKLLDEFKFLLIKFYESGNDSAIINFMLKNCIVRVRY